MTRSNSQPRTTADSAQPQDRISIIPSCVTLAVFLTIVVGTATWFGGKTMLEKLLTALVMPTGMVWMLLMLAILFSIRTGPQRLVAILAIIWLILTVLGNSYIANRLITSLEQPFIDADPPTAEMVDAIVVLGGGATTNLRRESQLSSFGDRIAQAAKFYHDAKRDGVTPPVILCTGTQTWRIDEADLDPRQESANLLRDLGVPDNMVKMLPGRNTYEEADNLKAWMADHPERPRIGIVTSAWHLPRALRLCRSRDIDAVGIASDFKSQFFAPSEEMIIPSGSYLQVSSLALKEYLAGLVAR